MALKRYAAWWLAALAACGRDERLLGTIDLGALSTPADSGAETVAPDALAIEPASAIKFGQVRLVAELSTVDGDEYDPSLTEDELEIFFRSARGGLTQIMTAHRNSRNEPFGAPTVVQELYYDGAWSITPDVSPDGLRIIWSSDRPGGKGGLDLYVSRRDSRSTPWSTPVNVSALNTPVWDTDPTISPDQLLIQFSRAPGQGADLYTAKRASEASTWNDATPVVELNTPSDEWDSAFALDGLLLLFTSNRDAPDLHIYAATRASTGTSFSAPVFLTDLNVLGSIDEDPWISTDGRHVMFASTRGGTRDLYEAFR